MVNDLVARLSRALPELTIAPSVFETDITIAELAAHLGSPASPAPPPAIAQASPEPPAPPPAIAEPRPDQYVIERFPEVVELLDRIRVATGGGPGEPVLPRQRRRHPGHVDHRRRRGRQLLELQLPRPVRASGGHRGRPGRGRPLRQLVLLQPDAVRGEAGAPGARGRAGGPARHRRRDRAGQRARHQRHRDRAPGRAGRPRDPRRARPQQHRAGRRAVRRHPAAVPAQRRRRRSTRSWPPPGISTAAC